MVLRYILPFDCPCEQMATVITEILKKAVSRQVKENLNSREYINSIPASCDQNSTEISHSFGQLRQYKRQGSVFF